MQFRIHHEYSIATDTRSLAIIATERHGRGFAQPFVFKFYPQGTAGPSPEEAFALTDSWGDDGDVVRPFLQACMDAAWDIGIRPTQAQDQRDELKAVRYHLEDMRALAFDKSKPTP